MVGMKHTYNGFFFASDPIGLLWGLVYHYVKHELNIGSNTGFESNTFCKKTVVLPLDEVVFVEFSF